MAAVGSARPHQACALATKRSSNGAQSVGLVRCRVSAPFDAPSSNPEVCSTCVFLQYRGRYRGAIEPVARHFPSRSALWVQRELKPVAATTWAAETRPFRVFGSANNYQHAIRYLRRGRVPVHELNGEVRRLDQPGLHERTPQEVTPHCLSLFDPGMAQRHRAPSTLYRRKSGTRHSRAPLATGRARGRSAEPAATPNRCHHGSWSTLAVTHRSPCTLWPL